MDLDTSKSCVKDHAKNVSFSDFEFVKKVGDFGSSADVVGDGEASKGVVLQVSGADISTEFQEIFDESCGSELAEELGAYSKRIHNSPFKAVEVSYEAEEDVYGSIKPSFVPCEDTVNLKESGRFEKKTADVAFSACEPNWQKIVGIDLNGKIEDETAQPRLLARQDIQQKTQGLAKEECIRCEEIGEYENVAPKCTDKSAARLNSERVLVEDEMEFTEATHIASAVSKIKENTVQDKSQERFECERQEKNDLWVALESVSSDLSENSISEVGSYRSNLFHKGSNFEERRSETSQANIAIANNLEFFDVAEETAGVKMPYNNVAVLNRLTDGFAVVQNSPVEPAIVQEFVPGFGGKFAGGVSPLSSEEELDNAARKNYNYWVDDTINSSVNVEEDKACKFTFRKPKVSGIDVVVEAAENCVNARDKIAEACPVDEDEFVEVYVKRDVSTSQQVAISGPDMEGLKEQRVALFKNGFGGDQSILSGRIESGELHGIKHDRLKGDEMSVLYSRIF